MDVNTRLTILRTLLSEEHSERKWREIQQNLVEWLLDDDTDIQVGIDQVVSTLNRLSRLAELEQKVQTLKKAGELLRTPQEVMPPIEFPPIQPNDIYVQPSTPPPAQPWVELEPPPWIHRVTTTPNITIEPNTGTGVNPNPTTTTDGTGIVWSSTTRNDVQF